MLELSEDDALDDELEDPTDVSYLVEVASPLPLISSIMKYIT